MQNWPLNWWILKLIISRTLCWLKFFVNFLAINSFLNASVSKRWCTFMFGLYFIGRFPCLQSDHKQTPIICTLINIKGEDFLTRMSSSTKPLTLLFERLMSFHHLKREPKMVTMCNDLILCYAIKENHRDYYICNPCTN